MAPRYSIVTPVYDPPADVLREAIDSVLAQTFTDWELILVDDCSPSSHVVEVLRAAAAEDARIVVIERAANGGIVAASNDGVERATGEFIALLDHDDTLEPAALEFVETYVQKYDDLDYCYSDEDLLSPEGRHITPFYKPDWSPERLRSQNYCCHFSVFRATLVREIGGFRSGLDGSQDYDIILRATERARRIVHIPHVLYHWRQLHTSVAGDPTNKLYAYEAGRRALQDHCDRTSIDATVEVGPHLGNYHVVRRVRGTPTVSVILTATGTTGRVWGVERNYASAAIESIVGHTDLSLEFIVVVEESVDEAQVAVMRRAAGDAPITIVAAGDAPTAGMRSNLAAVHAAGDMLLFVDDDVEITTDEFLAPLVALADESDVGAVGCKLYFADGRIQHAGHVYNGEPRHVMYGRGSIEVGAGGVLVVQRECAGVSSALMVMRSDVFHEVGGFSPLMTSSGKDVDLSLKLNLAGYRQIWTPYVEAYHFEVHDCGPGGFAEDREVLDRRWGAAMDADPYSNPNLASGRDDWVERGLR